VVCIYLLHLQVDFLESSPSRPLILPFQESSIDDLLLSLSQLYVFNHDLYRPQSLTSTPYLYVKQRREQVPASVPAHSGEARHAVAHAARRRSQRQLQAALPHHPPHAHAVGRHRSLALVSFF
jgi:hypothetical protein